MTNMDFILMLLKEKHLVVDTGEGVVYKTRKAGGKKRKPYKAAITKSRKGYLSVCMVVDGVKKTCRVHRIIWAARNGRIPSDLQINHKDCNKANNRIKNLEMVTLLENIQHGVENKCFNAMKGEENPFSKLTDKDVRSIRRMYATNKYLQDALASKFGVSRPTIGRVISRELWPHV